MQVPAKYRFHLMLMPLLSFIPISVLIVSMAELPSDFPLSITPITGEILSWADTSYLLVLKAPILTLLTQLISLLLFFHFDKILRLEKVTGRIPFQNLSICYIIQISSLIKIFLYSFSFLTITEEGFIGEGKGYYITANIITIIQVAFIAMIIWKILKGDIDKNIIMSNYKTNKKIYFNQSDPFIFNSNHYLNFGNGLTYLLLLLLIAIPAIMIITPFWALFIG